MRKNIKKDTEKQTVKNRYMTCMESPVGRLVIVSDGQAIIQVCFEPPDGFQEKERGANEAGKGTTEKNESEVCSLNVRAVAQLTEYFAGRRREFDLPLSPAGTAFQQKVWQALQQIPYGETRSYGQVAEAVGNPKASRAVGMANHQNPIPILIPCHRVIGADGKLVGYGGGLNIKETLLCLEQDSFRKERRKK